MPYSPPSKPSSDKSGRVAHVYLDESNFKISGAKAEEKRHRLEPKKHLDWHYDIRVLGGIIRKATGMKVNEETNIFVLVSGDSDMIPAVEYALEYDYDVHVFAWQDSVADEYKELARKDLIELTLLDNFLVTLTMARSSVRMWKLLNPWHVVGQLVDKLASSNVYLIQSLNDGSRPHNDVVVLPHKRVRDPDIRLRFMLEDFKEKGLNVMTLAEYSHSSHQIKLFGS
ncbi:hypothetical protein FGLOB1_12133 [Fusarium globosum]|uniref:NYN domain-containing protein n=1 Tax=Fusarium globosum TaxID=78864 RepID=A0A8H5XR99_9HYPO|nr:hypothetical protein FGLOB1_12133 [Fusarium globosum]